MARELTRTYEPNPILRRLYQRFFHSIQVDEAWVSQVRKLAAEGSVVYVLRNLNFIDFFALDHLTKRYALPQIRFVNDLGLWILSPMGKGWMNAILPRRDVTRADELRDALEHDGSVALFLKRPPGVLDVAAGRRGRGLKEGDELMRALFDLQRNSEKSILLVPQVFVWTKRPDTRGTRPLDLVLGPREWPSPARTLGQFLHNYKHVALKVGEPLNVRDYLASSNGTTDDVRIRRITYAMLRRLERERRSITGPAEKPLDRVRSELVRSPRLQAVIAELVRERGSNPSLLTRRALNMVSELQATPDLPVLKGMEVVFRRVLHRIYAGIEYDQADIESVREAARQGTLVLLPSHKSHIDYIILSYIFNEQNLPLPLIAAGDNLNFFPLGAIFRRAGAFFIRRSFKGDRLYAAVVDAYIRRLIRDGYPIELFLEGGRSRTGKLLPPKFGLLNMIVDAALSVPQKQVFFVPVSIGYERVIEAGTYEQELQGAEKQKEDAAGLFRTPDVLRHRYGRINLQVGQIRSLGELRAEIDRGADLLSPTKRRRLVTRLANRTMDEINRVTAVTPGALTALALLTQSKRGTPHHELIDRCSKLLGELHSMGARVTPTTETSSGRLRPEAIREAVQMFVEAEMVQVHLPHAAPGRASTARRAGEGAIYTVAEGKRLSLDTSKNIIIHFFVERALVAVAITMHPAPVPVDQVRETVQGLSRLFKHEFRFRADAPFDQIFDATIAVMCSTGRLTRSADTLGPGPGYDGWSGLQWLNIYVRILRNFLEGYLVVARALEPLLKAPMTDKELVKRALAVGQRMYLAGEIHQPEAVSQPILQNAHLSFADQGYLGRRNAKLALVDAFASPDALRALEDRIASYLVWATEPVGV